MRVFFLSTTLIITFLASSFYFVAFLFLLFFTLFTFSLYSFFCPFFFPCLFDLYPTPMFIHHTYTKYTIFFFFSLVWYSKHCQKSYDVCKLGYICRYIGQKWKRNSTTFLFFFFSKLFFVVLKSKKKKKKKKLEQCVNRYFIRL